VVAQSVHVCAPPADAATYFPVPQSLQTDAPPAAGENFPATQTWHAPSAVAPLLERYLPPPHVWQLFVTVDGALNVTVP
jgi:hypothetical protein